MGILLFADEAPLLGSPLGSVRPATVGYVRVMFFESMRGVVRVAVIGAASYSSLVSGNG